jgi:hypothetical protein
MQLLIILKRYLNLSQPRLNYRQEQRNRRVAGVHRSCSRVSEFYLPLARDHPFTRFYLTQVCTIDRHSSLRNIVVMDANCLRIFLR